MDSISPTSILLKGGIGIIPTDTLYGVVGSARIPETVERIYQLKRRNPAKPFIVLIANLEDIEEFGIVLSKELRQILRAYWSPERNPTSIALPTIDDQFDYLHRGTTMIAFRLPQNDELRDFLDKVGPLVAPSANMEGMPPARTIAEARRYFGSDVDFYIDGGELNNKASTLIAVDGGSTRFIRD